MMNTFGEGPVLRAMKAAGMAPVFSLFLKGGGTNPNGGEITLGGVNEDHIKGNTRLTVDVVGHMKFLLIMKEVRFKNIPICTLKDAYCKAVIDSGCSMIVGPEAQIHSINKNILSEVILNKFY